VHVLAALWDGGGTVPAEVGVVRRLVAGGHSVTVVADPTVEADVTAAGGEHRDWTRAPHRRSPAPEDDVFRDWECRTPVGVLGRLCDRMITGPAAAYAADVREQLAERPAVALVASGPLLGALIGAESMNVPAVALSANIYSRPAPGLPPFGSGMAPGSGPLGRARDRALNSLALSLWNRRLPQLNAARAQFDLPPLTEVWGQWDRAARVLVLTSAAFDLPAQLPANVRYVGPVLDDPVWAQPCRPPEGDAPLVVVGLSSSYMQQADVLRRIVVALDRLAVRAVVTTGPAIDPAEVPGTAKVHVVRSAPHAQLFAQADAVITHAGHGTLIKALAAGVPALCMPMGRDQADHLVRAARHGAALGLGPGARPVRIAAALSRLLDEAQFRENARRLGERLRADADPTALVGEIEAVTGRTCHHRSTRGDAR
jgi:UDP:flavonoid glycosyltransferase YjiC (YdhE family)